MHQQDLRQSARDEVGRSPRHADFFLGVTDANNRELKVVPFKAAIDELLTAK